MSKIKVGFIFIVMDAKPEKHNAVISTEKVELHVIGVSSYNEGVEQAKILLEKEGIIMLELCAGFGPGGVAKICEAVRDKIPVGVVRYDFHPGMNEKSPDFFFLKK